MLIQQQQQKRTPDPSADASAPKPTEVSVPQLQNAVNPRALPQIEIALDPGPHVYTLPSGLILPSVTQIMRPMSMMLYDGVPDDIMYDAANRGTRAHEQISNFVQYGVAEPDDDTQDYLEAFSRFCADFRPEWLASEYKTYHTQLLYAGTADLIGFITPPDADGAVDLVDVKCTAQYHGTMLATQVAAYAEAVKCHGVKVRGLYGLQLLRTRKYRFEKLSPDGFKLFLHCLAIHNAMETERRT